MAIHDVIRKPTYARQFMTPATLINRSPAVLLTTTTQYNTPPDVMPWASQRPSLAGLAQTQLTCIGASGLAAHTPAPIVLNKPIVNKVQGIQEEKNKGTTVPYP